MNALEQIHHIGPAFTLLVGAALVLGIDLITDRRAPAHLIALLVLAAAALYTFEQAFGDVEGTALAGAVVVDHFSLYFSFLLIAITAAVVVASMEGLERFEQ